MSETHETQLARKVINTILFLHDNLNHFIKMPNFFNHTDLKYYFPNQRTHYQLNRLNGTGKYKITQSFAVS